MKILIIGNGGREHAIAWKVSQSPLVESIYCAPGNGGTKDEYKCVNLNIKEIDDLARFAKYEKIDLTIVGPEGPLVDGIVDRFKLEGLKIFGPSRHAAKLEGSKIFAKEFMKKYGVKTAEYESFGDLEDALNYINKCSYPIVIKADGLAAGKGVVICQNHNEAKDVLTAFMEKDIFNGSGKRVVIEEYLEGVEASILSITDGLTILPFISSKDYKNIYDGNKGPNTGGMGAIAPNPYFNEEVSTQFIRDILEPTLKGIKSEGMDYTGIIFFGIMITQKGVYLLEYNVRMGDPETQAVLPLMKSDFVELILRAIDKRLSCFNIEWRDEFSCCVVGASKGYPGKYETGFEIKGICKAENKIFIAGASCENNNLITTGGRVLCSTATGKTLKEATSRAYEDISKIHFEGMYFRRDIGTVN